MQPYVPPEKEIPELSAIPLIMGTLLGAIFGASSLYLVLKVGLTVSASIPVAVISITLFRLLHRFKLHRGATILENNIVQTAGSAGESIAFGTGVTMPAILILGFDLEVTRVTIVAVLGGLLGILMMIPLRRALIVEQHGILKYPEGTACAEVLKAGDEGTMSGGAKTIFGGFALGLLYKTLMVAFRAWKDTPGKIFNGVLPGASISAEISPELLGVGYIIGPRIASIMCAGGILSYLVLIPAIKIFGGNLEAALPPGDIPISQMGPDEIRGAYVLYIGAGAVAAGGLISLARSLPTIVSGLRAGLKDLRAMKAGGEVKRTDRDLSMRVVLIGVLVLVVAIVLARPLHMNIAGAFLIVLFGFLFVTVSSRLTGEIGSSSNPISGMTVATLLLTCGIFLLLGWTERQWYVTALSVGGIVCIAASNGGTTSQDLKTGFLLGATPRKQQIAILVGALASALVLGPILLRLNDAATVYVSPEKDVVVDVSTLTRKEPLQGPQAKDDPKSYFVFHDEGAKYLVGDDGHAKYLVDPGINGTHAVRPDGTRVKKFDAPKATLMSYIIKGILSRKLPWGLVLLGVMISVVLEMSGIPSLAFAVGVYLNVSSSTPILAGGLMRWLVDKHILSRTKKKLTEEELAAIGDKSPGVLLASGYIAGGAIAGIVIAFVAGVLSNASQSIEDWSKAHNPLFDSDALSMIPFVAIAALLYFVGKSDVLPPVEDT